MIPFTGPMEFADFCNNEVGNRQCFGFVSFVCGVLHFAEYHGCGPEPEIKDLFDRPAPYHLEYVN